MSGCCCGCLEWCARNCCPGLLAATKKNSTYPGIQYSLIDEEEEDKKKTPPPSNGGVNGRATGRSRHVESATQRGGASTHTRRPPRPRMQFTLLQDGSHFSLHPQMGVSFGENWPVTEQPSPDHFLQRFSLAETESAAPGQTPEQEAVERISVPRLPLYREKSLRTSAAASHVPHHSGGGAAGASGSRSGSSSPVVSSNPVIQFSLHYDIHQSKLRVHLQHASDLPKVFYRGRSTRCDPFVMLHLEPDRQDTLQSEISRNSHDPEFNQILQFGGLSVDDIKLQTLVLRLYNSALNNKAIGRVCLPLRDIDLFGVVVQMKIVQTEEMESNFQGDLLVSLSYSPVSRKLSGIISKATGLRKHDLLGKADPYVKVVVTFKDTIVYKWKSSVKHNTLAPVYNETFNCKVTEEMSMAMDYIAVSFYIVDFDYLLRNDTMGVVMIGQNVESKLGRKHWNQVLQSPRQGISFWHSVQLATQAQKRHMRSRSPSPLPQ